MSSYARPTLTFELQDISPDHVLSLIQLHFFCGKTAGMYAIADFRARPGLEPRPRGLCGRLYGEWFELVESDPSFEIRFFARFLQTDGLDVMDVVKHHKVLSQQLETQMREPIERVVEGERFVEKERRDNHENCTLLPTFKNLVIGVEEENFRADTLLVVLDPGLAEGIEEMKGAEESEVDGQKVVIVRMKMEVIMRAVVAMQKKALLKESGIVGQFVKET